MKPSILLGAPGTGKTYQLVQRILERKPKTFALVTFTRRAAKEAKDRLKEYYDERDLTWVRTIHSMCFKLLGLKQTQVFTPTNIFDFGRRYGYEFTTRINSQTDDTYYGMTEDDIEYRNIMIQLARLHDIDLFDSGMYRAYTQYKAEHQLIDFHDMIARCLLSDVILPEFDLLCVDEIQDLTPLQIAFINRLKQRAKEIIYAGDGNQMIFEWAGVSRQQYTQLVDQCDVEILERNYRLSLSIEIKSWQVLGLPDLVKSNNDNSVIYAESLPTIKPDRSYLILARNNYILKKFMQEYDEMGFTWEWLSLSDQLPKKTKYNIHVSTIHGAKGAEADNVILLTDVSPATYEQIDTESEKRVWYVGTTRARSRLYIFEPQTDFFFDLS